LTIFFARNAALWRDEGKTEGSPGGSLPHVRREAGRKMRAQHGFATYESASRPAFDGFRKVVAQQTGNGSAPGPFSIVIGDLPRLRAIQIAALLHVARVRRNGDAWHSQKMAGNDSSHFEAIKVLRLHLR
jgi:hypothetical protein